MKSLYSEIEPYNEFDLKVSDLHTIHVEESGNKYGKPVIFLHGGPGGGLRLFIAAILILKSGVLLFLINADVEKVCLMLNLMKIPRGI